MLNRQYDQSLIAKVGSIPLFSNLNREQLQDILSFSVIRRYPRHKLLVASGETADLFYILLGGSVKVFSSDEDGREVIISILRTGSFFGELGIIDMEPRSASVAATEPLETLVMSKDNLRTCLLRYPEVSWSMMQSLSARLRIATRKIETLALLDVYGRVARLLLEFAKDVDGRQVITQRLSKHDIARMIGASREMVSRVMRDLTNKGLIETVNRCIHVTEGLAAVR